MKAESRFDKKKKERRIAALLALASEKKSDVARCLTGEEMALLVDGNCSVQEKERGWAHLSDCQECYDQWYVLKMEEREGRKEGGIVHLMRPKTFAVVGSTLAVAASIAVFLNIPQAPFPDHLAEDSVQSQQVVKKTDTSLSQVVEPEVAAEKTVILRKTPRVMYEKMEMELKEERSATKTKRPKTAAAPQSTKEILGTAGMMAAEVATGETGKAEPVEGWLEMVQEGCLKRQTEGRFWAEIVFKGEQLFHDTEPGAYLTGKEAEAFAVFLLIPRSFEKDLIARRCEQILAELAEREKSR